jgi:hypothetical protein
MSKMDSHDPFDYLKYKLWPKEGSGVKVPIWFPPTKSQESPWNSCVQMMCNILLERSWYGLQLFFKPHFNRRSAQKVRALQNVEGPNFGTKWHLDATPMANHKKYYKGEGNGFPQVWAMVSLVNPCMPMAHSCTKSAPTMH